MAKAFDMMAGLTSVKVVARTEADLKERMKGYGYPYVIGGYAWPSINALGDHDKAVKINKVNGVFVAKFMTVVK